MSMVIAPMKQSTLTTMLRAAIAFREIIVSSSCGREKCDNCDNNAEIIEEVSEAIDAFAELLNVNVAEFTTEHFNMEGMPEGMTSH